MPAERPAQAPGLVRSARRPAARWLCAAAALLPGLAAGQIVNAQARFADLPEPGFKALLEGAVDWRTGSNDYLTVRGSLVTHWLSEPNLLLGLLQGEFGLTEGQRTLERTLAHLRYRRRLWGALHGEGFLQHEYDGFRRLQLRALAGAGPRWSWTRGQTFGAATGAALMVEHERIQQDGLPDAGARTLDLRLSGYALARWEFLPRTTWIETLYVQPNLVRWSDVRVLLESAVVVKANPWISMGLTLTLLYDSAPPSTVPAFDTQLRSSVAIGF